MSSLGQATWGHIWKRIVFTFHAFGLDFCNILTIHRCFFLKYFSLATEPIGTLWKFWTLRVAEGRVSRHQFQIVEIFKREIWLLDGNLVPLWKDWGRDGAGGDLDWGLGETGSWTDWGRAGTLRRRTASTSQRHQQAPSLSLLRANIPQNFLPEDILQLFLLVIFFLELCAQSLYFCVLDNVGFEDHFKPLLPIPVLFLSLSTFIRFSPHCSAAKQNTCWILFPLIAHISILQLCFLPLLRFKRMRKYFHVHLCGWELKRIVAQFQGRGEVVIGLHPQRQKLSPAVRHLW